MRAVRERKTSRPQNTEFPGLEQQLATVERFRAAAWRVSFHTAKPHDGLKGRFLEPGFAALGLERIHQVVDFSFADFPFQGNEH